jgi:hypothetical protein
MDTSSQFSNEETPSRMLSSVLDFVALAMERPDEAASRAALLLTGSALAITVVAFMLGEALVGVTFAAVYAAAGWALSLYFRRGLNEGSDDA